MTAGQRVLVNGAGGGVGGFVTQVIATASTRSLPAVRAFGADQIVDYTAGPVADALDRPVDTLLNLVPLDPAAAAALAATVRPGGRAVSVASPVEPPTGAGVTALHMVARNDVADLAALAALVEAGEIRLDVSASYPLSELAEVHRRSEAGLVRGKVVIIP
ncbi:zinc-binding dehydrogenase [Hamadaea tsunoensis]|uniref:zinc-binding dehydrogenase n=1 Tax=Hamadaea tsunoensis TaxID=53368 RepID=UPI001FE0580C|nr:zinc-binding dehydrogenase [Hamadaea tsunoensis]